MKNNQLRIILVAVVAQEVNSIYDCMVNSILSKNKLFLDIKTSNEQDAKFREVTIANECWMVFHANRIGRMCS